MFSGKVGLLVMKIAVIDGLGGGLGAQIIKKISKKFGDTVEIIALGTNSAATARMLQAGGRTGSHRGKMPFA